MTIHRTSGHDEILNVLLLRVGALQNAETLLAVADVPEIRVHIGRLDIISHPLLFSQ